MIAARHASPSARAWLWALGTAALVVLLDQLAKAAVRDSIAPGETRSLLPGLQLVNTRNRGIAFGFLPGRHWLVTALIALALLVLLVYFARHSNRPLLWLPSGMLLGGALGNVLDRIRAGSVTDFVKLPLGWPPFNLADAAITIGVLLLALTVERGGRSDRVRERRAPGSAGADPRVPDPRSRSGAGSP